MLSLHRSGYMHVYRRLFATQVLLLSAALVPAKVVSAAGLADSGVTDCDSGLGIMENCSRVNAGDSSTLPRQDGRYGQDAATLEELFEKTGAGDAGFDYTKIGDDGVELSASAALGAGASDWACTRDNVSGLTWEVKSTSGLQRSSYTYTWYDSNGSTNGGDAGMADTGNGVGSDNCSDPARCDTQKYVADVNTVNRCNHNDWRLPTVRELLTIFHGGVLGTKVDVDYFPNLHAAPYWTSNSFAMVITQAWQIDFGHKTQFSATSNQLNDAKTNSAYVIVVRGNAL